MADIEYFYAAHSAFAYIGAKTLQTIVDSGGHRLVHKPYDLRAALVALAPGSTVNADPSARGVTGSWTPARSAYFFGREIERWAAHRDISILPHTPTHHANDIGQPNRFLIAGIHAGLNIDRLSATLLEAHWANDADLADADTLVRLATGSGYDGRALLAAADHPQAHATYDANTREAVARHVFGSPTYFVGGDMFYGQDRLEFVARALVAPYPGRWPR